MLGPDMAALVAEQHRQQLRQSALRADRAAQARASRQGTRKAPAQSTPAVGWRAVVRHNLARSVRATLVLMRHSGAPRAT